MLDAQHLLSIGIQEIRKFLYSEDFFEKHLYSLASPIKGTNPLSTEKGVLRFSPEPDVWVIPPNIERFFFIGSLFRDERIDALHAYEFTTADIYFRGGGQALLLEIFWKILDVLAERKVISNLNGLNVKEVEYCRFTPQEKVSEKEMWLLVTHYPVEESFFDAMLDEQSTQKSELFLMVPGFQPIEIASLGRVGANRNSLVQLEKPIPELSKYISEDLFGLCFGIERLMTASKILKEM